VPDDSIPDTPFAPGEVRRVGQWAVGRSGGRDFAVSRRCRHQLADLSDGRVDADGCLVCPWHGARYDVRSGRMVDGPQGFLTYRGPTPGYSGLVKAYSQVLKLRVGHVVRTAGRIIVRARG
jgi:nitrite reductase/ring-hydroxylating ferredoxin subunit